MSFESVGEPDAEPVVDVEGVGDVVVGEGADLRRARRTFSRMVILGFEVRNNRSMRGRIVVYCRRAERKWYSSFAVCALARCVAIVICVLPSSCTPLLSVVIGDRSWLGPQSRRFRNSETGK